MYWNLQDFEITKFINASAEQRNYQMFVRSLSFVVASRWYLFWRDFKQTCVCLHRVGITCRMWATICDYYYIVYSARLLMKGQNILIRCTVRKVYITVIIKSCEWWTCVCGLCTIILLCLSNGYVRPRISGHTGPMKCEACESFPSSKENTLKASKKIPSSI